MEHGTRVELLSRKCLLGYEQPAPAIEGAISLVVGGDHQEHVALARDLVGGTGAALTTAARGMRRSLAISMPLQTL